MKLISIKNSFVGLSPEEQEQQVVAYREQRRCRLEAYSEQLPSKKSRSTAKKPKPKFNLAPKDLAILKKLGLTKTAIKKLQEI